MNREGDAICDLEPGTFCLNELKPRKLGVPVLEVCGGGEYASGILPVYFIMSEDPPDWSR